MFENLNWGAWLYGLGSGFIGGGAGAATSGVVAGMMDPTGKFALGGADSVKLMVVCFLVNGVFSAFFYLKQHPLPDVKVVTTVETVAHQAHPEAIITTTVEETKLTTPHA